MGESSEEEEIDSLFDKLNLNGGADQEEEDGADDDDESVIVDGYNLKDVARHRALIHHVVEVLKQQIKQQQQQQQDEEKKQDEQLKEEVDELKRDSIYGEEVVSNHYCFLNFSCLFMVFLLFVFGRIWLVSMMCISLIVSLVLSLFQL